jgi:subtilisin family serine protease
MPVKLLILSILLFVFSENSLLNAQSHIENQLLVQLNDREKIADIISEIKTKFYIDTDINVELITRTPIIIWKLEFAEGLKNMRNIIHFLNSHEHVVNAQFNHVIEPRNIPNDPQFGQQWHLKNTGQGGGNPGSDIDAERAWDLTTGGITPLGDTIVICVIDNGLDLNHEDIHGNIWINHNEIPGNGIDDDNNGYIDDYYGWNSVDKNGNISKGAHGTQASGLIGAKGNNNKGVAGINWDIKIMPVIFGGSEAQALASYSYAYQMRKIYN